MTKFENGTRVLCFGKSLHVGQTGVVEADYGQYVLIKPDDQNYIHAHKLARLPGSKYFQADSLCLKILKD